MFERFGWIRSAPSGYSLGVLAILLPVVATTSLDDVRCDNENPRVESYYSLGHDYMPQIMQMLVRTPEGESIVQGRSRTCMEREGLKLCFDPGYESLRLEAFNESAEAALVEWSRGVFIDENGARRKLDSDAYSSYRPTMEFPDRNAQIPIGERTLEMAWPEGKQYYNISGCKDAFILREPLVPARLTGSEESDRVIVDRVVSERIPLVFEFPARHGSAELHFRIEILILDRMEAVERIRAEYETPTAGEEASE